MDERDDPVRHETTVINTGGDGSGGSGGLILGVLVALLVGVAAFLYFGGYIGHGDANRDINVNIKAPDISIKAPDVTVNNPPPPSTPPANSQ
jgi:hypothetical protein